jgi:hypothetical protein
MSADEIDRMMEESRRNDWREPWEEWRDVHCPDHPFLKHQQP